MAGVTASALLKATNHDVVQRVESGEMSVVGNAGESLSLSPGYGNLEFLI